MKPIHTPRTTGIYGAPPGREGQVGGLPFYRDSALPGVTAVYSVWTFSEREREWIAKGRANLVVGIVGMEPIPPISLSLQEGPWVEEVTEDDPTVTNEPTTED